MARAHARTAGALLVLLGAAGFLSGGSPLFGTLNADPWENAIHLAMGALLLLAGFSRLGEPFVRLVVFAQGTFFAVLGCVGFFYPTVFGLLPGGLSIADDVLHVALAAASITAVELSGRNRSAPGGIERSAQPASPRPRTEQPHL